MERVVAILGRVRAEFLEMPGLRLTAAEAQRLCGVDDTDVCRWILDALVQARFLQRAENGVYSRRSDSQWSPVTRAAGRAEDGGTPTTLKRSVLVADGDGDTRSLYREMFFLQGYDVLEATNGRDALAIARAGRPSAVVLEARLPVCDGESVCHGLRGSDITRDMPIVVVTAETRPERLARVRAAGADRILVKPVRLETIILEMSRLVDRRKVSVCA
jgi:two-component system, chemotaxis family, chemotaxis protein CheY